jgi:proteasome lid subunit RPN8/RPN11
MSEVSILRLTQDLSDKIGAHGAETYPYECCGALLGRDLDSPTTSSSGGASLASREVTALFPLVNRRDDSPRNRFSVTSEDVRDAEKAAREKGTDVVGWYHSHPDHPAKPSQFDQDHAWPWYSYIIVSVANGRPETMTSWRLADDRTQFTPENLEIAGKDAAAQSAS